MKILIVEDIEEMRELMKELLRQIPGVEVTGIAANTWEARVELDRRRPELVVLDEILPGESSLDLLQELSERKIAVYLVTGVQDPSHPVPSGVLGRLRKPTWKTLAKDLEVWKKVLESLA